MFFSSWHSLLRIAVVGVLAYVALVFLLRISGKRTLSKMNAFDFVVTVAIGSTLATVLLSQSISLADGVVAFSLLIFLQFAITWLSVRSGFVRHLVKAEPLLLYHNGDFLWGAMKKARVTHGEMLQAMRSSGDLSLEEVAAIVLETDGTFSIISTTKKQGHETLSNVNRYKPAQTEDQKQG